MAAQEATVSSGATFPAFALPKNPESPGLHRAIATAKIDGKLKTSETLSFFVRHFSSSNFCCIAHFAPIGAIW